MSSKRGRTVRVMPKDAKEPGSRLDSAFPNQSTNQPTDHVPDCRFGRIIEIVKSNCARCVHACVCIYDNDDLG